MKKLTAKQQLFVDEYLIDLNATQAAIRAGYSPKNADKIGFELLGKTRDSIDRAIAVRSRRTGISQDRVIIELARIALVKPTDVINTETATVKINISDDDAAAIAGIKIKDGKFTEREVRLHDKVKALELLGRHLGMFKDKVELTGAIPVVIKDDITE